MKLFAPGDIQSGKLGSDPVMANIVASRQLCVQGQAQIRMQDFVFDDSGPGSWDSARTCDTVQSFPSRIIPRVAT